MTFENVAERPDEALSRAGRDARPGAGLQGAARRGDGKVDIGLVAGRNMGDDLLGGGVLDRQGLAAAGVDPLAVDQHLVFFGKERGRGGAERGLAYGNRHQSLPGMRAPFNGANAI